MIEVEHCEQHITSAYPSSLPARSQAMMISAYWIPALQVHNIATTTCIKQQERSTWGTGALAMSAAVVINISRREASPMVSAKHIQNNDLLTSPKWLHVVSQGTRSGGGPGGNGGNGGGVGTIDFGTGGGGVAAAGGGGGTGATRAAAFACAVIEMNQHDANHVMTHHDLCGLECNIIVVADTAKQVQPRIRTGAVFLHRTPTLRLKWRD